MDELSEVIVNPELTRLKLLLLSSAQLLANELTIILSISDHLAEGKDHDDITAAADRAMAMLRNMLHER